MFNIQCSIGCTCFIHSSVRCLISENFQWMSNVWSIFHVTQIPTYQFESRILNFPTEWIGTLLLNNIMNSQTVNRKPSARHTNAHHLYFIWNVFDYYFIFFFSIYRFPLKNLNIYLLIVGGVFFCRFHGSMPKRKMIHCICDERQTILSINLLKFTKNLARQWSMFHRKLTIPSFLFRSLSFVNFFFIFLVSVPNNK